MTLDRTGEEIEPDPPPHTEDDDCTGWIGDPNADHPKPCPVHKPHLAKGKRERRVWGYDPGRPA